MRADEDALDLSRLRPAQEAADRRFAQRPRAGGGDADRRRRRLCAAGERLAHRPDQHFAPDHRPSEPRRSGGGFVGDRRRRRSRRHAGELQSPAKRLPRSARSIGAGARPGAGRPDARARRGRGPRNDRHPRRAEPRPRHARPARAAGARPARRCRPTGGEPMSTICRSPPPCRRSSAPTACPPNGALTPGTAAALSGGVAAPALATTKTASALSPARRVAMILANMEMWRWEPHDMGEERIEVNIPDFSLRMMDGDTLMHSARVIVGKPDTPTPVFSNSVKYILRQPDLAGARFDHQKEFAPHLADDPNYLAERGYEVKEVGGRMVVNQPPGRRQRAWPHRLHVPQRARRLSARHERAQSVRRSAARLQPRLRARRTADGARRIGDGRRQLGLDQRAPPIDARARTSAR